MFKAKDGTEIEQERWGWQVIYKDGSQHHQFDVASNTYNNFASIDLDKVQHVVMHNFEGKSKILRIPEGAKLIHYYDNLISQPLGGSVTHHRLYCFGYETEDEKVIYTILPTDVIIRGEIDEIEVI